MPVEESDFNLNGVPGGTQHHPPTKYSAKRTAERAWRQLHSTRREQLWQRKHQLLRYKYDSLRRSHLLLRTQAENSERELERVARQKRKSDDKTKSVTDYCMKMLHKKEEKIRALYKLRVLENEVEVKNEELSRLKVGASTRASASTSGGDSGLDTDEYPDENAAANGAANPYKIDLNERLMPDEEIALLDNFSATMTDVTFKHMIVNTHTDLRLISFTGAEQCFETLEQMRAVVLAAHGRFQILHLVYMRVGRALVEFFETSALGDFGRGASLCLLDFAQHTNFFDFLYQNVLYRMHKVIIRNVRGVTVTDTVRGMLADPHSCINRLEIFHFLDVRRVVIRFEVCEVLAYLHHYDSDGRRKRYLDIFTESVNCAGDVIGSLVGECKYRFIHSTRDDRSAFVLVVKHTSANSIGHQLRKTPYKVAEKLKRASTGEVLIIKPIHPAPSEEWKFGVKITRRPDFEAPMVENNEIDRL